MLTATFSVSFTVGPGADVDSTSLIMQGGAVGFPYTHKFIAKNPAAVWTSTDLPAGATLAADGTFNCTPTTEGTCAFHVSVGIP